MLPTPYKKEAQPFEHFDHPEALARHVVRREIENGTADEHHERSGTGWYGHHTEIRADKIIVMECAGETMERSFNYQRLVKEERQAMAHNTLFDTV